MENNCERNSSGVHSWSPVVEHFQEQIAQTATTSTYADDTQIFYGRIDVVINCDLRRVDQWLDKNSMKRHPSKKVIVLDRHVIDIAW